MHSAWFKLGDLFDPEFNYANLAFHAFGVLFRLYDFRSSFFSISKPAIWSGFDRTSGLTKMKIAEIIYLDSEMIHPIRLI